MSTLEARISELRTAADSLEATAGNVRGAVSTAYTLIDGLLVLGFQSPAATVFFDTYRRERTVMDTWPEELDRFARSLTQAANAIEEAVQQEMASAGIGDDGGTGGDSSGSVPPPIPVPTGGGVPGSSGTGGGTSPGSTGGGSFGGVPFTGSGSGSGRAGSTSPTFTAADFDEPEPEPVGPPPPLEAYANRNNQELLTQMQQQQAELETTQTNIDRLATRRGELQTELDDLLARMNSAGGVTPNARIRGLQEQIAGIDAEIAGAEGHIDDLQTSIQDLQTRLERVSPNAGADLNLIASLEDSQTSQAILNATRQADNSVNCVNWVCSRMPIPPGIPNNAYLWPENALAHPEYGIRMGDVPLAGSVMVMQPEHPFADDRFGHVLFVERVDASGNVWVTDNFNHEPVLLSSLTDVTSGPDVTYMYFPWETQG